MQANDVFNSTIDALKNSVALKKQTIAGLRAKRKELMAILRAIAPSVDSKMDSMSVHSYDGSDVTITINMYELDGFKDQRLMQLMYAIMCLNDVKETSTEQYPEYLNCDYKFTVGKCRIQISAWVKKDSATCKRVKIGEKTHVVAEYKIECE